MKKHLLLVVIAVVFAVALIGCGKSGGGKTPEDAVKGMMEAVKAGKYENAVEFVDVEGMVTQMRAAFEGMMKGMEGDMKKEMQKELDKMSVENMKKEMIEGMKKDSKGKDFTFKILETKDKTDKSAIVVVEVTEDGKTEKEEIPVIKVGNLWKVGMAEAPMGTHDPGGFDTPVIDPPVIDDDSDLGDEDEE